MSANFARRKKKGRTRGRRRRAVGVAEEQPPVVMGAPRVGGGAPIPGVSYAAANTMASWQMRHQIAYWKSKAVALEYENKVLHAIIADLYGNAKAPPASFHLGRRCEEEEDEDVDDRRPEFEISEEMLAFLQTTAEHKRLRDREKSKVQAGAVDPAEAPPDARRRDRERERMTRLYGAAAGRIGDLETAVRLNFDRFVDAHDPVHWPNIPLKL